MIIIRAVLDLAMLALVGILVAALSGHLWGRYREETVALGFSGVYERLASQVGLADGVKAVRAIVKTELGPALADLLARQVQIMFVTAAASIEYMPSTAGFTSRQSRCPLTHVAVGRRGAVGGPGYSSRAASRATGLAGAGRASAR